MKMNVMQMAAMTAAMVSLATARAATTVLVEAESFAANGGWKEDSQFVEVMGSPMLIAHGMGVPVANATTTVAFAETGDYAVWVRTRNWVPAYSNTAAPGRFKVAVNGSDLAPVFGTEGATWHWQSGGTVTVTGASATIALEDLTGFDGRCDAIAFIKGSDAPPPDGGSELAAWRKLALGESDSPTNVQQFDCVIVGGGMAGCSAAIAAARAGVRVALVQDRPVLGGNASSDIRVATRGEVRHSIVGEIDTTDLLNRDDGTVGRDIEREMVVNAETNVTLFMPYRAYGVGTNASHRITYVDVRHATSGARVRLQGSTFIDCTGDAWIGYWAGADWRMGREASSEYGETLAPATADAKTMGNSLMWKSYDAGVPSTFPSVPWATNVSGNRAVTGGDWNWEYGMSLNTITNAEDIRDHLLRAIYGNFRNAKLSTVNSNLALAWVPYVAGKRESRRLMGDHILTQIDLVNGAYFEDAIATTDWGIDQHYETAVSYLSSYTNKAIGKCFVPFRSLYSRNVPNLLMAGRCFSCTHIGLGSPRVQNTTAQMGVAVGTAAAICKTYGIEPRDIYRDANRTVELQSRITGTWPQRPILSGTILDNTNPSPTVLIIGGWASSSSVTGYYGTSYLNDSNALKGTKRVSYTPKLDYPGRYAIAMRWAADANRATNTPVWVCTTTIVANIGGSITQYIRNAMPGQTFITNEMLVGRVASSNFMRGLLQFDLSSITSQAIVVDADLEFEVSSLDTNSVAGYVGAEGLRVYRINQPFTPAETTWSNRTATNAWTTAGGDFDTNPLTIIPTPVDPNLAEAGDAFVFPSSNTLTAAAANAVNQKTPLGMIVRTPGLETAYNARKLYRFGPASLTIKYYTPQLPATYYVNQRLPGNQWVTIGTNDLPADGFTVVIGNDNTTGNYVIADAVRFTNPSATTNDIDGDGLIDAWERYYFLSQTSGDPDGDADGDGRSNFVEYMNGTDPLDPGSRFDMRAALDTPPGQFAVRWTSVAGRTYRIETSDDMITFSPLASGIAATPSQNTYNVSATVTQRFYRAVLEPPP